MAEINYKQSQNAWPLEANYDSLPLYFSGTFSQQRIEKEDAKTAIDKINSALLAIFAITGVLALVYQAYLQLPKNDWLFFLHRNVYNLVFYASLYTDLYIYARAQQRILDQKRLSAVDLQKHGDAGKPLDVYSLFDKQARKVWSAAGREIALSGGRGTSAESQNAIILKNLLEDKSIEIILMRLRLDPKELKAELASMSNSGTQNVAGEISETANASEQTLPLPYQAMSEAIYMHAPAISSALLLFALINNLPKDSGLTKLLRQHSLNESALEMMVVWETNARIASEEISHIQAFGKNKNFNTNKGLTAVATPYLNQFSEDLTAAAKFGRLPFTIGREADLDKIFQLFSENIRFVLIKGSQGTGRSSLLYELAYKMVSEDVPTTLEDRRLVQLDISTMLGSHSGSPESVMNNALDEAQRSGNIILAIEDIHLLAKATSDHGLNLLEVLVGRLAGGSLMAIATTTPADFLDYLRTTGNFEQTFSVYDLQPLDNTGIIQAVCLKASFLEGQHKVFFTYEAIEAAVRLSTELFKKLGEPQAAIAVLTEVASKFGGGGGRKAIFASEVEEIISEKSHVPQEALKSNEKEKLLNLEAELSRYVIGQKQAVSAVAEAIRRSRSGLASGSRPIGSFLFVGPTGVGKTELAKTLARVYFGGEQFFLRLDMSEYQGNDGLQKLIGAGSVSGGGSGANNDTVFVKHLKDFPFCLFLLDEFEKASRQVLNLFLQILEDGRLTTGAGEVLDLTKTIIIATSNAGTTEIQTGLKSGEDLSSIKSRLFEDILVRHFAPELLNRFDDIILFAPLSPEEVAQIAKLFLQALAKQLKKGKDLDFTFSEQATQFIASQGYNPTLGARPIRRYIQDHVENLVARTLLENNLIKGAGLKLDLADGALTIKVDQ